MDPDGTYRIVYLTHLINEFNAEYHHKGCYESDKKRARRADHITAGCDCHQTGQGTVQCHGDVRLSIAQPGDNHGGYGGCGSRQVGGYKDIAGRIYGRVTVHGYGGASVKTEPAEPKNKYAKSCCGKAVAQNRVWLSVLSVLSHTRSQYPGSNQGRSPAAHMDGCGAREIVKPHPGQPTAAPNPVSRHRINHCADDSAVDTVRNKFGALRHGT